MGNTLSAGESSQRALAEAARIRLAAIVESSDDAIIGKDLDDLITDWNFGAEKIFGYTAAEMIGTSIKRLIPGDRYDEADYILEQTKRGESFKHSPTRRITKEGRLIHVSVTVLPLKDDCGKIIGAVNLTRDITEQWTREREFARLTRLYGALSQINQAIAWAATREELFQRVCQILVEHGGISMAWAGWHHPPAQQIMPLAVCGDHSGYVPNIKIFTNDQPEGNGPTGLAFRMGQSYICNDMLHDPAILPWRKEMLRRGFKASAAFPIRLRNEVAGTLTVYSEDPVFFQDKEIILLEEAARDVSFALDTLAQKEDRQQAEQVAQNEKLFSAAMIESMPGILYFYDVQGRFLRWNRNFEIVSGYSGSEISRMHPLDFILEAEKETLKERIAEVFEKGESFTEASFVAKGGKTTPYFFTGRRLMFNGLTCLIGVGIDISERRRAELGLRETQGQLEAVVENLREGLIIADLASDSSRWNLASLRMLGFNDLEKGNRHQHELAALFELYTLDGFKLPYEQWPLARVRRGEDVDDLEIHVRRTGSDWERIFSYSGSLVRYAGDKILAFMTMRDITERKRAEMSLRVLNQTLKLEVGAHTSDLKAALVRAEAADRIKSAFLATMSHELRTPLNSIIGFTGIVLQGLAGPLNVEQSKQLGMVRTSARHLLELINDVLDLSKIEAGQLEVRMAPFNLRESLERVTALVKPLMGKKGLELSVLVQPPELNEMISDRRRVEQVLLNLLNNAIKFTEHGRITVTAEALADYKHAPNAIPRPAVRIRVADTGIGIKPEDLATLFQPFRQIDSGIARQHEGTGLGLVICRRLAALLGGEIIATSEWLKGSEFTAIIPLQKSENSANNHEKT